MWPTTRDNSCQIVSLETIHSDRSFFNVILVKMVSYIYFRNIYDELKKDENLSQYEAVLMTGIFAICILSSQFINFNDGTHMFSI